MTGIRLEIDEDGHNSYDDRKEKHREDVIHSRKHRIVWEPVERQATYDQFDADCQQIVNDIWIIGRDTKCEIGSGTTEKEFVREIYAKPH